jgi:uncharacterized protein (TIGR02268 family)
VRHLELSTRATGGVPELRISPGLALTLIFDTPVRPIRQGGVELEERGRFQVVSLDEEGRVLTLVLARGKAPERPLRLVVHFADGGVPASATFHLLAHPARAEHHVQVYREPRSAEVCCQQADAEREKARHCLVELERTRADSGPGGLIGLRSQGLLDSGGVPFKRIEDHELTRDKANALKAEDVTTLRTAAPEQKPKEARARVAVLLTLRSPEARDWKVEGAQLASQGRVWRTVTVWQSASLKLKPGVWEVMVEAELTQEEARGRFTLKLWEASGTRTVTLGGVTFP